MTDDIKALVKLAEAQSALLKNCTDIVMPIGTKVFIGEMLAAIERLSARVEKLEGALAWYEEHARLARLVHSEGDKGRHAISEDGGKRARAVLSEDSE